MYLLYHVVEVIAISEAKMVQIIRFICKRCNHEWFPRVPDPLKCPKCQAMDWDEELKENKKND